METLLFFNVPRGPRLAYAEFGDPAGFPVIVAHGWPGSRLQLRFADEKARARGLRLIGIDRPGIGRSDPQPGRQFTDFPPLVAALADHLGLGQFAVIGESGGGPYTVAMAATLPERITRAAVICGAPPLADFDDWSELFWVFRFLLHVRKYARWAEVGLIWAGKLFLAALPGSWPLRVTLWSVPKADRRVIGREPEATYITETNREAYRRPRGVVEDGNLYLEPWGIDYAAIRVPMAFWHGALDRTLPIGMTRWLAEQIPGAEFHARPDDGHYSIPIHAIDEVLDWVAAGKPDNPTASG